MLRKVIDKTFKSLGLQVARVDAMLHDLDADAIETIRRVSPYTLTSAERIYAFIHATRHVVAADIPGSIVECGVWRGGSMMACALTLRQLGVTNRDLYLFDTYAGMPQPSSADRDWKGQDANSTFERTKRDDGSSWCYASVEEVTMNLESTGYPAGRVHIVKGRVEDTIPRHAPADIAILRLDTDWYESTRHELEHLYPRLSVGGVLILDDYGHWQGSRKATDEYFAKRNLHILLSRVDQTGRIAVKP